MPSLNATRFSLSPQQPSADVAVRYASCPVERLVRCFEVRPSQRPTVTLIRCKAPRCAQRRTALSRVCAKRPDHLAFMSVRTSGAMHTGKVRAQAGRRVGRDPQHIRLCMGRQLPTAWWAAPVSTSSPTKTLAMPHMAMTRFMCTCCPAAVCCNCRGAPMAVLSAAPAGILAEGAFHCN